MKKTLILLALLAGMTGAARAFTVGVTYTDVVDATNIHIGSTSNDYIIARNDAINYDTTLTGAMVKWSITFTYDFDIDASTHKTLTGNGSTIAPATNGGSSTSSLQVNVKTSNDTHAASLTYGDNFNNNAQIAFNAADTLTLSYDDETNLLTLTNNTTSASTTYDCTPYPGKTAFSSGNVRAFTQGGSIPIKVTAISGQAISGNNGIVTLADGTEKDYGAGNLTLRTSGRMDALHADAGVKAYVVDGNAEAWFAAQSGDADTVGIQADIYLRGNYTGDGYGTLRFDTSSNHTLQMNGNVVLGSDTKISSHAYNPGNAGTVEINGMVAAESLDGDKYDLNLVNRNNGSDVVFNNTVDVGNLTTDNGSITFNSTANVDGLTIGSNKEVVVSSTGTLNIGETENTAAGSLSSEGVTFVAGDDSGLSITKTGTGSEAYSVGSENFTIAADSLTVSSTQAVTINNQLVVGAITNNSAATLNHVVADYVDEITAKGNLTLESEALVLQSVTLGSNVTLKVVQGETESLVTVTGTLDAAGGAKLLANLKLDTESTFTLSAGALTLGSSLELGENITLNGDYVNLENLQEGSTLTLIQAATGTEITYGNNNYNGADAAMYFADLNQGEYTIVANGTTFGIQKAGSVPEPTTGTLSLLALAGLCARRRRK